jgi:hypothetical protein
MDNIDALLRPIRDKHKLPALAGAIVSGEQRGGAIALGAVGVRKAGDRRPLNQTISSTLAPTPRR